MSERLIVYSCRDKKLTETYDLTVQHLRAFDKEIRDTCGEDTGIEVANGNECFPVRRAFLRRTMLDVTQDGSCNYNLFLVRILDEWYNIHDSCDPVHDKVLIIAHESITRLGELAAHGIVYNEDRFAFLVQDYWQILWHEAAHLFGAEDHYRRDDHNRPAPECKDQTDQPQLRWCLMQWDPGVKDCRFCAQTIEEIRNYFAEQKARREMRKCPQKAN